MRVCWGCDKVLLKMLIVDVLAIDMVDSMGCCDGADGAVEAVIVVFALAAFSIWIFVKIGILFWAMITELPVSVVDWDRARRAAAAAAAKSVVSLGRTVSTEPPAIMVDVAVEDVAMPDDGVRALNMEFNCSVAEIA